MALYKIIIRCAPLIGTFILGDKSKFPLNVKMSKSHSSSKVSHFYLYTQDIHLDYLKLQGSDIFIFANHMKYPVQITIVSK